MKPQLRLVKSKRVVSTLNAWRDDYLESKRVKLESKTIDNYRKTINMYIEFVGETHWPPTRFDVVRFLDEVQERASKTTVHTYWAILRAWFNYMAKVGAFDQFPNPAQQIEELDLAPQCPKTKPKGIPKKHMLTLLKYLRSLPKSKRNVRDLTLVHFLYRTGARVGEASILTTHSLQLEFNRVYFEADLVKDDEDREIFFGENVKADLRDWLSLLFDGGYDGIWVFPSTCGNQMLDQYITVNGIYQMFRRRLRQAGLPMYRTHDLRHTFTKTAIRRKIPLSSIQKQLGHASPDMVLRYAQAFSQDQEHDFIDFGDDE